MLANRFSFFPNLLKIFRKNNPIRYGQICKYFWGKKRPKWEQTTRSRAQPTLPHSYCEKRATIIPIKKVENCTQLHTFVRPDGKQWTKSTDGVNNSFRPTVPYTKFDCCALLQLQRNPTGSAHIASWLVYNICWCRSEKKNSCQI